MKRPEITVVNHYDILPYNHGGTQAIRGLYKGLSSWFDINIVCFTDRKYPYQMISISDNIRVYPINIPADLENLKNDVCSQFTWAPDDSPAVAKLYHESEEILEHIRSIAEDSMILIAEHAYTWNLIYKACPEKHLWYREQNVEYDYKKDIMGEGWMPENLLHEIYKVEKSACKKSELVLAISDIDSERLCELYNLNKLERKRIFTINAGYDATGINPIWPSLRAKKRSEYDYIGIFIATGNAVTVEAAKKCIHIAEQLPNVGIVIMGNVCDACDWKNLPTNIKMTGVVSEEEKKKYFETCDFALNLIEGGSGVNIKMFEYFAYGIPVIVSRHGARGIDVVSGQDCIIVEPGMDDVETVRKFCHLTIDERESMARNANSLFEEKYTWKKISESIAKKIEVMYGVNLEEHKKEYDSLSFYDLNPMVISFSNGKTAIEDESSVENKNAMEDKHAISSFSETGVSGMLQNTNEELYSRFRFPFEVVRAGSRIVIYGGGVVGKTFLGQVARSAYCNVVAICDQDPANTGIVETVLITPAQLAGMSYSDYDRIIVAIEKRNIACKIREDLILAGIDGKRIVWIDPAENREVFTSSMNANRMNEIIEKPVIYTKEMLKDFGLVADSRFEFPWNYVKKGARIVVYGGGVVGKMFLLQALERQYINLVAVCDRAPEQTGIKGLRVINVAQLVQLRSSSYDLVLIANEKQFIADEIIKDLKENGIPTHKILWIDPSKN